MSFGQHVSIAKTLYETIDPELDVGCTQIYFGGNTNYNCRSFTEEDIKKVKTFTDNNSFRLYVHCPLILNFGTPNISQVNTRAIDTLQKYLDTASLVNGKCVLHIGQGKGRFTDETKVIDEMRDSADQITSNLNSTIQINSYRGLLLENSAGQGSNFGWSWNQLRLLYEKLDTTKYGLCLDTQHSFASGLCSFDSIESVDSFFENAIECAGKIDCIHLNDSKVEFGKRVDRHETLTEGKIWKGSTESLIYLLDRCIEESIDCILETPIANRRKDYDVISRCLFE